MPSRAATHELLSWMNTSPAAPRRRQEARSILLPAPASGPAGSVPFPGWNHGRADFNETLSDEREGFTCDFAAKLGGTNALAAGLRLERPIPMRLAGG